MSRSKLKCRLGEACDGGSCSKAADVAGHLIRPLFFFGVSSLPCLFIRQLSAVELSLWRPNGFVDIVCVSDG